MSCRAVSIDAGPITESQARIALHPALSIVADRHGIQRGVA